MAPLSFFFWVVNKLDSDISLLWSTLQIQTYDATYKKTYSNRENIE